MKLQFDANLEYQEQAVSSVVDLFRGQTPKQSNFTVSMYDSMGQGTFFSSTGIGNKLELDEEDILDNLKEVQLRNGLKQSTALEHGKYDFDIEMETGTGKTYVYLRTIFELNANYGFTKFIIVVPSIAIKEGVSKSLDITKEHFDMLFDNTPYDYFVYDSGKLSQVRDFATADNIQIMVINIDAFRKSFTDPEKENKANLIHRSNDKMNGMRPIDLIAETNPFVIIDEPQSVDTTPKSKEAIASLNPLCTLRYSATHVDKHNCVYKLDAIDAFEMNLVKQIEVASFATADYHNRAYMLLKSVDNKKSPITAKIEIDALVKGEVKRKVVTVKQGSDLSEKLSGNRAIYEGYIVDEIYCEKGEEYVSFTMKPEILRIGRAVGDIDDTAVKEQQIRKTIEEHLNKELILSSKGVKVLSLFFIDRVANYRYYDDDGVAHKGRYAELFEKHYKELIQRPKYKKLIDAGIISDDETVVHNGYFSVDKKGVFKDTNGNTTSDDDAYNLIMKDKEKLLSFDTKLRFIFSHSALREGWDNPNVFQICTLNETNSDIKKRQEIGRGLRLCVNQTGERLYGSSINTLTVMANESYEDFAKKLQKEYETDEGIRFGFIEKHTFANITVTDENGEVSYLGAEKSADIYKVFEEKGYIDNKGKVQDKLKKALKDNTLEVPDEVKNSLPAITAVCKKISGNLNIKPASEKKSISLNKQIYLNPDFKELWDRIKYKTSYSVSFKSEELIRKCSEEMKANLSTSSAKLIYSKAELKHTAGGLETTEKVHTAVLSGEETQLLPDIVTYLQANTSLTRRTLVAILKDSGTLDMFKKNPQRYMEDVNKIISANMKAMLVDGIKYTKLGDDEYYAQELFDTEELTGYLEHNMIEAQKSVYEYVVYDSDNEAEFAKKFEANEDIKLYAKLPDWFKISTPLGSYNPDWAVLIEKDGDKKLYFVLETKANVSEQTLRQTEYQKIKCGRKHFEALGNDAIYEATDDFNKFVESI
ncbi:MAG: DEAD/DEAH box helicase family protein [Oscillospiraceae bacterium]|nr:DEAD/DEAH box helicase family protein [Oscillospiraceae bacterium]